MNKRFLLFLSIIITIFIFIKFFDYEAGEVLKVIDGDTFKLKDGRIVRLIGIDAPEKNELCFNESKNVLKSLLRNKVVILKKDSKERDKYGRLLRYVYLDSLFINLIMVRSGYAKVVLNQNEKYYKLFKEAEYEAKKLRKCIWK